MLPGILTVTTFTPLVGALIVAAAPTRYARSLALAASLATWVISLLLVIGFDPHAPAARPFQLVEAINWIPVFGIQYKVGVDGLSLVLVVLTTTLTWISILASFSPIKERIKEYMVSFLVLEVGDGQAQNVAGALRSLGYLDVTISRDLAGKKRVVEGRRR